ncbi:hypothetical protein Hdeb2414_s0010g00349201 [Helianthus debilis subsp. tardiflorus]
MKLHPLVFEPVRRHPPLPIDKSDDHHHRSVVVQWRNKKIERERCGGERLEREAPRGERERMSEKERRRRSRWRQRRWLRFSPTCFSDDDDTTAGVMAGDDA